MSTFSRLGLDLRFRFRSLLFEKCSARRLFSSTKLILFGEGLFCASPSLAIPAGRCRVRGCVEYPSGCFTGFGETLREESCMSSFLLAGGACFCDLVSFDTEREVALVDLTWNSFSVFEYFMCLFEPWSEKRVLTVWSVCLGVLGERQLRGRKVIAQR